MNSSERHQTAIKVAKMYYLQGVSQDEIAAETGMSRSNISRILNKCLSDGIVEIMVHDNISERSSLAYKLCRRFGLKDVIIAPTGSSDDRQSRHIGERMAMYLEQILRDDMLLGLSGGYACYYASKTIRNPNRYEINVVQLSGSSSSVATVNEPEFLVNNFAVKLNGRGYLLCAPLMVRSLKTKQELFNNSLLRNTIKKYPDVDVGIFEIGKPDLYTNDLLKQEWLTKADLLQLSEVKAVSCICGYYFDINGRSCNVGINDRIIAIGQQDIRNIPISIGVITGKNSLDTALSAIRSGMINVLFIDESLALMLENA